MSSVSDNYLLLSWSQTRPDSLSLPSGTSCDVNIKYNFLNFLTVTKSSPYFHTNTGNIVIYTGFTLTSKLRVYMQFYFNNKPTGNLAAAVVNNSRTGCSREVALEVVTNTFSSDYPYIGNAIIIMDGSNPDVDVISSNESWLLSLRALTGTLPIYSAKNLPNLGYISFTPYVE